jgi:N-acetylglutamate synthase/N-acetylornithine aminotransferase
MQVEGGVTAAKGFKAAGIYGGLRAKGEKPDLALVACDVDATVAGKKCDSMRLFSYNHCKSYLNVPFAC